MIVGIDLGTTNSLVGIWRDGRAQLLPNALGHVLTPSCVSIDDAGQVLVGLAARDRLLTHPEQSASVFKRYMGTEKRLHVGDRVFRPEELSALVLKSLKADAEAFLGEAVMEAVITVPAYFNDTQRKATRIAGELAGFKVERLLNEPTAAALAYGLHKAELESQFLVFDLGGGTFDVSILEIFSGVMEVRATAGDNFLGGEDFVTALVEGFFAFAAKSAGLDKKRLTGEQLAQLRIEAERVKRVLSSRNVDTFAFQIGDSKLEWQVSAEAFECMCGALLERLRTPVERTLRDANLSASALNEIILVGGASRMPIVHRLVARLFGRFPNREINPDEAIALGAAIQAGLKARDAALNEVVLTDVCPYTLGVEVSEEYAPGLRRGGVFLPILERNTVIPASRAHPVASIRDYQTTIALKVYQGESRDVNENILLGTLDVALPRLVRAEQQVIVRFTYDINGLLEVEGTVTATGLKETLVIEQSPGSMSKEEIRRSLASLAKLKIHPRDETENAALTARLKRLFEQHLQDRRAWIGQQLAAFETVLDRQDPREIVQIRADITRSLDAFEGSPLL
jgi:molecular chaperone HscC